MTFYESEGDLFNTQAKGIGHGVNCRGLMGAGIAVPFRDKFPLMYEEYKIRCERGYLVPGEIFAYYAGDGRWVYNIASQFEPGPNANLWALTRGVNRALSHARAFGVDRIALPQIGCGIGGLTWPEVRDRLVSASKVYPEVDLEVVTFKP